MDIGYSDLAKMGASELGALFVNFNKMIATRFGFASIDEYLAQEGKKGGEIISNREELIGILDMIKPTINLNGVIVGFQIKPELVRSVFMQCDYRFFKLKSAMKLVIQLNHIISLGEKEEF